MGTITKETGPDDDLFMLLLWPASLNLIVKRPRWQTSEDHVSKRKEDMVIDGAVEAYRLQLEAHFRLQLRIELEQARATADNWEVEA